MKHEDQWALEPGAFDGLHARGGEWRVELARIRWDILDAFREAAEQAGIPKVDDFNRGNNEGCGYFHVNQQTGVRWNTAKGFLHPVAHRANLKIETHALVEQPAPRRQARHRPDAAPEGDGAHQSTPPARSSWRPAPSARRRSCSCRGSAPAMLLAPLGIEVRHELKGVGENLQDHLQVRCAYKVTGIRTMNESYRSLFRRAGFLMEYLLWKRGPMTMAPSQLGAFVRSDPSRDTPNLQYHVQPLTLPKFGEPLDPFPAFTASVANLRPTSRGWVRIVSPDPQAHPEIRPNYLSTADDRRVAADAIRMTRHIVSQPALARYHPQEFRPGPDVDGRRRAGARRRRHRHHHLPPRSAPARWAPTRPLWWTPGSRYAASRACGSPTPR